MASTARSQDPDFNLQLQTCLHQLWGEIETINPEDSLPHKPNDWPALSWDLAYAKWQCLQLERLLSERPPPEARDRWLLQQQAALRAVLHRAVKSHGAPATPLPQAGVTPSGAIDHAVLGANDHRAHQQQPSHAPVPNERPLSPNRVPPTAGPSRGRANNGRLVHPRDGSCAQLRRNGAEP
ncbi:hypothetical protein BDY17DRAFT_349155 [Neohortaea acidophila]|uniref:Uncharacterized protein n=1 Tax=Neohortaea acidophila TaxID=245834 RepID=A0A6A6PK44_9PEZI|nr:uncharacterized protein BDY17DRAFT_349155 [Neohortaea acidophila]KAF2479637.1 hypothetical protein BDY17DRAFT_349155 [Neohortaea acidophila]